MAASKHESSKDLLGTPKAQTLSSKKFSGAAQFEEDMSSTILSSYKVAQARASELKEMLNAVGNKCRSKRTFQKLPRHMRRRAASYNVKRLPRRMREAAHAEMNPPGGSKSKPPSRRKRRHPDSLAAEYKRRSDKETWLETHVWHAKRMKMGSKWGYKLALRDVGKGVRATYRGLNTACLMSDMSYYHCLELSGTEEDILTAMSHVTSSDTGLTCAAVDYRSGEYRGRVMLYGCDQYPFGCIGPANVMWRPEEKCSSDVSASDKTNLKGSLSRMLWVWVHPLISEQVGSTLDEACSKVAVDVRLRKDEFTIMRLVGPRAIDVITIMLQEVGPQVGDVDVEQRQKYFSLLEKTTRKSREDVVKSIQWWNECKSSQKSGTVSNGVSLCGLRTACVPRGAIFGFVVRDPRGITPSKCVAIAYDRFEKSDRRPRRSSSDEASDKSCDSSNEDGSDESEDGNSTSEEVVQDGDEVACMESSDLDSLQCETSAGKLSGHCQPQATHTHHWGGLYPSAGKSTSVSIEISSAIARPHGREQPARCALVWDDEVRRAVTQSKVPEHVINQTRTGKLVRSKLLQVGDAECRIPLLLVSQELGTTTGAAVAQSSSSSLRCWDLVCPGGWSMALLVNGVYHGARVCGLEEMQRICFESNALHFPTDYPDTRAALSEARGEKSQLEENFSRRPPAKRPNYGRLAVNTPFDLPWNSLFSEAKQSHLMSSQSEGKTEEFFVLRSKQLLKSLSFTLACPRSQLDASLDEFTQPHLWNALVAVELVPVRRGNPERFAMLCVPTLDDVKLFNRDAKCTGPEEPIVPRGTCFVSQHQVHIGKSALLKQALKQAKASWKKNAKKVSSLGNKCNTSASSSEVGKTTSEQASARLPTSEAPQPDTTGNRITSDPSLPDVPAWFGLEPVDPSRRVVGYVTSGGYQHSHGKGFGIGFCPLTALVGLVRFAAEQGLTTPLLLMRNPSSKHYVFVSVSIH